MKLPVGAAGADPAGTSTLDDLSPALVLTELGIADWLATESAVLVCVVTDAALVDGITAVLGGLCQINKYNAAPATKTRAPAISRLSIFFSLTISLF